MATTSPVRRALPLAAAGAAATVLVVAAWCWIEQRAPDFDPQYARDIVERSLRFGGTYYENGIHNKGPLEPFLYEVATWFTSDEGYWFGISAMIVAASALLGYVAAHVVRLLDGPRWLGIAAGAAVYVHLTLSGADYAGVLYSRNMTVALLGIAFVLLTPRDGWPTARRRATLRILVAGACLGLAVQTLQTATLTVAVVGLFGLVALGDARARHGAVGVARARLRLVAVAAITLLAAPAYYLVIGSWRDFWDGWWVYGRYMSQATGRSLAEQLGLGWHEHYLWLGSHAPLVLACVAFVGLGAIRWSRLTSPQRRLHVALPAWYVAGWFEIILTQRYSSHYYVVVAVPAALMVTGLGCHVVALIADAGLRIRGSARWIALTLVVSLVWSGTSSLVTGIEVASGYHGVDDLARARAQGRDGTARSVQAVLDLVGRRGDPMLAWTNYPWPYLDFDRVSATRFIWKSFLMGEIYLGRTDLAFVLPGSWARWAEDVEESSPVVALTDAAFAVPPGTPFADLLSTDFAQVLTTPTLSVSLRRDVLSALVGNRDGATWAPAAGDLGPGWGPTATGVTYAGAELDETTSIVRLGDLRCTRLDATVFGGGGVSFHVLDPNGESEVVEMFVTGGEAVSRSPNVEFLRLPVPRTGADEISLIVGTGSAVLLVNGIIGAALTLLPSTQVELTSTGDAVELANIRTGPAPTGGEC